MELKKVLSLLVIGGMAASLAACGDDKGPGEDPNPNPNPTPGECDEAPKTVELSGLITEDTLLCAASTVVLKGMTYVTNGATLTIEAGTKIYGENGSALVITADGKIKANGTASAPIVFTSSQQAPVAGDWGGVVLLGKATLNIPGGVNQIEGIDPGEGRGAYGGNDDTHDCGSLTYTRIEYAGYTMGQDNELNGLTLGGCGNKTTLHHIQVIDGLDDGIEFFGGNVDLKYALVVNPGDDGVDFDEGYRGKMQFIAVQIGTPNSDDPRGFEWDSFKSDVNADPRATVVMSNATVWQTGAPSDKIEGAMIRRGAGAELFNVLLANVQSKNVFNADADSIDHISGEGNVIASAGRHFPTEEFARQDIFSTTTDAAYTFATAFPPIPAATDFETDAVAAPTDAFFTPAAYVGAFDPSKPAAEQWTAGWTR